jgi:hypothetical protein
MPRVQSLRPGLILGCLFFGLALTLSAQESPMIGTWEGTVIQDDGKTYSVLLKIERLELQSYAGTDVYTGSVNCTGLLTFRRQRAGLYEFTEAISSGRTCSNGRVELYAASDGKLQWEWYEEGRGGDPEAHATLSLRR